MYSIELEREISDSKPTFRSIHSVSSELKIDCFKLKFTIVMAIASSCQGHRKRQPGTFFFCQVATGILCFIAATALGLEHSESMGKRIDRSVLLKSQRKADTKASFFRFAQAKMCGNGVCDRPIESLSNCPLDCSEHHRTPRCGNNVCDRPQETYTSCPTDCPRTRAACGDNVCDRPEETYTSCPTDCPRKRTVGCGDKVCDRVRT